MTRTPHRLGPLPAIALSLLLAACGGDGSSPVGAPSNPSTPAGAPPPTSPSTTPPPSHTPSRAVATAVGQPIAAAASATIGPAGGALTNADGELTVVVPPGAFDRDRVVSIQEISNHAHGRLGRAWRITPEGLNTSQPMTLRFRYTEAALRGTTAPLVGIATQARDGTWKLYRKPVHDAAAKTLSVATRHFSDWSLVAGAQLLPAEATVNVSQGVDLRVMRCEYEDRSNQNDPTDLSIPMPGDLLKCDSEPLWNTALQDWSANGTVGGSASSGTVQAVGDIAGGQARYTAPAAVPSGNPVAVSVRLPEFFGVSAQTLVSHVTVRDPASACAHLRTRDAFNGTWGLRYAFNGANAGGDTVDLVLRADITARLTALPGQNDTVGKTWMGPASGGTFQVDSRATFGVPVTRTVTTVGSGSPYIGQRTQEGSYVMLHIDFSTCRYTTAVTVQGRTVSTRSDNPTPQEQADSMLGTAQAFSPRPVPADGHLVGSGRFTAHSPLWVMTNEPGDVWVPISGGLFYGGYAAEGLEGTAEVEWALSPES